MDIETLKRGHEELKKKLEEMKKENEQLESDKDELLTRLSKMASSKLRDNNPSITDLSDPNRPTKLAEQMSELYDNEWTDAFEEMENTEKSMTETDIIQKLLDILMTIYSDCRKAMAADDNYFRKVQATILCVPDDVCAKLGDIEIPVTLRQEIKDYRKAQAPKLTDEVAKALREKHCGSYVMGEHLSKYFNKCAEISWKAVVQDPPLVINTACKPGDRFNKTNFRDYTVRGPLVDYLVWPCLQLHENGPILCKGVAQGRPAPPMECEDTTMKIENLERSVSFMSQEKVEVLKTTANISTLKIRDKGIDGRTKRPGTKDSKPYKQLEQGTRK